MTAILQGYGKVWMPIGILAGSIVVKLVGNLLFIPLFTAFGAALAGVVASFMAAIGLVLGTRRLAGKSLADGQFYRKLFRATLNMVVVLVVLRFGLSFVVGGELSRTSSAVAGMSLVMIGAVLFVWSVAKYEVLYVRDWFLIPLGRKFAALQLWLHRK